MSTELGTGADVNKTQFVLMINMSKHVDENAN